jgi:Caspase domain
MSLKFAMIGALVMALAAPAASQAVRQHVLGGRALAPVGSGSPVPRTATSTEGSADARAVVQRIVSAIGIPMTQFEVRASSDVSNAEATTENGGRDRLILYNPAWMDGLKSSIATNWSDWLVLAHEVGHHVAFHMDPTFPNHEAELQADYFAGFILEKLGAPLPEVQLAMAMVSADQETATHPAKAKRVAEVRKGWEAAARNVGANVIPAAMTVPDRSAIAPAPASAARPEQRVALLIGNTHYKSWGTPLKNPKNDVIAVGRQLRSLGFATTVIYDGTSEQISTAIAAFRDEATGSDWALIYYAGTGIEVEGANYMIPIDADDRRALTFGRENPQMRLDTAFEAVKGAKRLRLVIADACRIDPSNLPDARGQLKNAHTFKVTEPPRGVLVAYSTAAGQYAQDGSGDLSPYALAMIAALREPGIEMPKVFRRVSAAVDAASQGTQLPTVIGNWPAEDLYVSQK